MEMIWFTPKTWTDPPRKIGKDLNQARDYFKKLLVHAGSDTQIQLYAHWPQGPGQRNDQRSAKNGENEVLRHRLHWLHALALGGCYWKNLRPPMCARLYSHKKTYRLTTLINVWTYINFLSVVKMTTEAVPLLMLVSAMGTECIYIGLVSKYYMFWRVWFEILHTPQNSSR